MKYPNQDPPIPVHRGWAEHRAAKNARVDRCFNESHVIETVDEPTGKYKAQLITVTETYLRGMKRGKERWATREVDKVVNFRPATQCQARVTCVSPTSYAQKDAVKIERAKPDRIERRKMLKAERKSKKALKTHGSLGAVRTPFDKKADWPDLPNPNANRDKEWAKARREAKKAQKERAIQLRLAG